MKPDVVMWSGGADSTMLLTERAHSASKSNPVIALSFEGYPQLPSKLLSSQNRAQRRYAAWAKGAGLPIEYVRIDVRASGQRAVVPESASQPMIWATAATFFPTECIVMFGYIRGDEFWHLRAEFDALLLAFQRLSRASWEVLYPYEWSGKDDVLIALNGWGVPDDAWWSCDGVRVVGVPCRRCKKCIELSNARKAARKARKGKS